MFNPKKFFDTEEEARIIEAIRMFEGKTSGEIRVHVERRLRRPPLDEAAAVFAALNMHHTALRNGVLILLAPDQHAFAIYADTGIYELCDQSLWDTARDAMREQFKAGNFVDGLLKGIALAGTALAEHFPRAADDTNELSDDISYG